MLLIHFLFVLKKKKRKLKYFLKFSKTPPPHSKKNIENTTVYTSNYNRNAGNRNKKPYDTQTFESNGFKILRGLFNHSLCPQITAFARINRVLFQTLTTNKERGDIRRSTRPLPVSGLDVTGRFLGPSSFRAPRSR